MDKNRYIKVQNESNFVRDRYTGALVNINLVEINRHKQLLEKKTKEKQEFEQLKSDVAEIKDILMRLINKE